MKIIEIREETVPLQGNLTNAVVSFDDHTVSIVALVTDVIRNNKPLTGFGFNSIGRYGQSGILRERMIPRILQAPAGSLLTPEGDQFSPAAIADTSMRNEKPGGHGDRAGAAGALELACWDLNAKLNDEPACDTIARAFDVSVKKRSTDVYAAGGYYYPGDSTRRLDDELAAYQQMGFEAFKIKIGGASLREDLDRIETAVNRAGAGSRVAVDANGRFDEATATDYASALDPLDLRWFEEPGDPLDYALNKHLTDIYQGPIATGENLFSRIDVNNLILFGGMRTGKDIFQMDAGLSYGLTHYAEMLTLIERHGFSRTQCYPHGGHLINLHIAIGLGLGGCEAYPGVFQPFGGYPDACEIRDGSVSVSDAPGFGLEQKSELGSTLDALNA